MNQDENDDNYLVISWSEIYAKSQQITFAPSLKPVKNVTYMLFGGTNPLNALSMNSLCSIEHVNKSEVFNVYYDISEDTKPNKIKIDKAEIERIQVLGIIAMFNDAESGEIVTLAYEPFSFVHSTFGV